MIWRVILINLVIDLLAVVGLEALGIVHDIAYGAMLLICAIVGSYLASR